MAKHNEKAKPAHPVRLRRKRPCPVCQSPSQQKYHPFCSARCADVDLHRWLGGQYAIPAVEPPDFDDMGADQRAQNKAPEDDD
ncbi:MAG: DNA gyrase inhibitor YacG [Anderseniella sp.]|nr:DNA gyrase inhibitor YacG [Anderseniella sp.]